MKNCPKFSNRDLGRVGHQVIEMGPDSVEQLPTSLESDPHFPNELLIGRKFSKAFQSRPQGQFLEHGCLF